MLKALPGPEVVRRYVDAEFHPRVSALCLRWPGDPAERLWELPDGVCLSGAPPERFGVAIERRGGNSYAVRLLWNHTVLSWSSLGRVDLLTSALAPLLGALGTDLWHVLEQPVGTEPTAPRKAA